MQPTVFTNIQFRNFDGLEVGGLCQLYAPATNMNYGDAVFFSAADTVNKTVTPANYTAFAGFVVGGDLTDNQALISIPTSGTVQVATSGKTVLVALTGVVYCITAATPAAGASVIADATTAGRVAAGSTAGQMLGTLVRAGTAGNLTLIKIAHR